MEKIGISHADIVTSHDCNMACKFCIDKFRGTSKQIIRLDYIESFLITLKQRTKKIMFEYDKNPKIEILLLGGEPTLLGDKYLIEIANLVHSYGFEICISTNGIKKDVIKSILPYFDWVQITVYTKEQIDFWRDYKERINIKLAGDETLTIKKFVEFSEYAKDFGRRSLSMYFKPNFEQICKDEDFNKFLDTLDWERMGSYEYSFYNGVRIKRCINGVTNIADEPLIPKLYPNGNYNKTWQNEDNDEYLGSLFA